MADDEKEKAEKLAAAKKRFEQLKKQKAGGGGSSGGGTASSKKSGSKKKDESSGSKAEAGASTPSKAEDNEAPPTTTTTTTSSAAPPAATDDDRDNTLPDTSPARADGRPPHNRQASLSLQSKMRSEAFRGGSGPLSPSEEAQDIYRKQALRIEELERANRTLTAEAQEAGGRLKRSEEALESLREASGEVAELKSRADQADVRGEEVEKLKAEIASLKRQNTQLATQASKRRQSQSVASPVIANDEFSSQLASKSAAVESLELEISNLNNKLTAASTISSEHLAQISTLENNLARTERESEAASQELADLKKNLKQASERAQKEGSSKADAETRIAQLETELAAAQRASVEASKRAETLEKKVEALQSLHRESDARHQAKQRDAEKVEREARDLRSRVATLSNENSTLRDARDRLRKADVVGADDGVDELEDEERQRLAARVRELEEEVFELRRGVWRDKRREMQPGMEENSSGFDEVDLSGLGYAGAGLRRNTGGAGQHSSLQDVINSGISAFTGGSNLRRKSSVTGQRPRGQSLGLLSGDMDDEDFEFDEDAFRVAQEEEAKKRIERIKDIKRGLTAWQGWRVDLVDMRAGMGGVFDV